MANILLFTINGVQNNNKMTIITTVTASIDEWLHLAFNSLTLVVILWTSVWAYSLWSAKRQYKEIIRELYDIKTAQRKNKCFYEV